MRNRVSKWAGFWENKYSKSGYATNYGAHLYLSEALCTAKELQGRGSDARILSLGTGLGQVEIELLSQISSPTGPVLVATDILHFVLKEFHLAVQAKPFCRNVIAVTCDAYQLPFQENSFDVVISFDRAWVASYKGVAPEVARVTKPGGMVIMDFINDLSAYELFLQNWRFVKRLLWYLGIAPGGDKYHDLGCMGIKRSYSRFGLELSCLHYIGACSPLGNAISIQSFGLLEKLWPMKRVFSRILLGVFTKKAE